MFLNQTLKLVVQKLAFFGGSLSVLFCMLSCTQGQNAKFETITFDAADGLKVTADLYKTHADRATPLIVLCHQAGWSRGEYREIAPKLNKIGFNCIAIDQRSGGAVNGVSNETANRSKSAGKGTQYLDAEADIVAALNFAKQQHAEGKLILWGSSYSASLALKIAGERPDLVDAAIAFAPGEYFGAAVNVADAAKPIAAPVFITSAKREKGNWQTIYDSIASDSKVQFVPTTAGNHGSRALWKKFEDSQQYWEAIKPFLKQFKQ